MKLEDAKLSNVDRMSRTVLGFALIGLAYFATGPLGLLSLLPILAIAPLMTAAVGYCPVEGALRAVWRQSHPVAVYTREGLVSVHRPSKPAH